MAPPLPDPPFRINRHLFHELDAVTKARLSRRAQMDIEALVPDVQQMIAEVRTRGDAALAAYARRFDGADLTPATLAVTEAEIDAADEQLPPELRHAIVTAIRNVRAHHSAQLPTRTWMIETMPGVLTGERLTPIPSVGLYVPRGKGSFPSVMMMLAVPAALAKVPQIVACTPPGPDGTVDAATLVTARLCGVNSVFKAGGAPAIAALAYGTDTIPRVRKIVGPGNAWVSAAKRLVYGDVDPGPPAGPSESIVLCDDSADPRVAAHEWLVEAEHGPDSAALLVTPSQTLADDVVEIAVELVGRLPQPQRGFCQTVLGKYGGVVVTRDLQEAVAFVNSYAPEHLRLLVARPMELLNQVTAGEVLLGEHSSIPFANFCAGVNAILPTGGNAHTYSCVGVADFLKRSSFVHVGSRGVGQLAEVAVPLAEYEGFPAHAAAARHAARTPENKPAVVRQV